MDSITITRPVIIKVRVTEGYKKVIATELQALVKRLDQEIQQLEYQNKHLQGQEIKQDGQNIGLVLQKITEEIQQRVQKRQQYLGKIKDIGQLTLGTEVVHGKVESLVDLNLGDNWNQVMNVEVLVEDGKVLEIRQGFFDPHQ